MVDCRNKIAPAWLQESELQDFLKLLHRLGIAIKFVGGCVRDSLLGRTVQDLDLAVDYSASELFGLLRDSGCKVVDTGLKHGTLTVVLTGRHLEITSLREDIKTDGRHAEVQLTNDWSADAARRDFGINAIYLDPDGTIFDPLGGQEQLRQRRVIFIGNPVQRIQEDYLRILRFFRFSSEYADGFDESGLSACRICRNGLKQLSADRIRGELSKILAGRKALQALQLMETNAILQFILSPPFGLKNLRKIVELPNPESADWLVRLVALGDGQPAWTDAASKKLLLSRRDARRIQKMLAPLPRRLNEKIARRFVYRHGVQSFMDALTLRGENVREWNYLREWHPPKLPLNGWDVQELLKQCQLSDHKSLIGKIIRRVETEWITKDFILDRLACTEVARRYVRQFLTERHSE